MLGTVQNAKDAVNWLGECGRRQWLQNKSVSTAVEFLALISRALLYCISAFFSSSSILPSLFPFLSLPPLSLLPTLSISLSFPLSLPLSPLRLHLPVHPHAACSSAVRCGPRRPGEGPAAGPEESRPHPHSCRSAGQVQPHQVRQEERSFPGELPASGL